MSEGTKKVEETEQDPSFVELSEQDLEKVAGGQAAVVTSSRSNIRNNIAPETGTTTPSTTSSPVGGSSF